MAADASEFTIERDGVVLAGTEEGEGTPVVLAHGLTSTRRYVVMGSRALARSGHRVVSYDARAHGHSAPAHDAAAYSYEDLAQDLEAVLAGRAIERAVIAGVSMGAHTALRVALSHRERVAGLVLITPGHDPAADTTGDAFARWDALARGLREGGVEGFVRAYELDDVAPAWRATLETAIRQRMAAHEHPLALADALEAVPRSRPFDAFAELASITCPTVVIGSRDEADPGHPLALARAYADALAPARLIVEDEGSPIAWQGGRVSRVIAEVAAQAAGP
jgi:pimeloyl-ACP methyl ester carboxylesterase